MIKTIKTWWKSRRLDRAQDLIQSYGLTVVKIKEFAGTSGTITMDSTGDARRALYMKRIRDGKFVVTGRSD